MVKQILTFFPGKIMNFFPSKVLDFLSRKIEVFGFLSSKISIYLGTTNTLVYIGDDLVLDEPSIVALIAGKGETEKRIIAVGKEARMMLGKTPKEIEVIRLMKDGVIADFYITEQMIKHFIQQASGLKQVSSVKTSIIIPVPYGATQVESRAIRNAALAVGANRVEIIERVIAAAIGAGLSIESSNASIVVDIGSGTTEIGVISFGGLVYASSTRVAGDRIDEVIINYIRSKYSLLISGSTAEIIKKSIGSAHPSTDKDSIEISGRNVFDGLHKKVSVNSIEIREALEETLNQLIVAIKQALEATPPELSDDLTSYGIILTGGGALLSGIDILISESSQLKAAVANEALRCVSKGCVIALNNWSKSKIHIKNQK